MIPEEIKKKIKGFLNQAQPTYSGMDELAKLVYSLASEQLAAAEARIKELEEGLGKVRYGLFASKEGKDDFIDQLLNK